MANIERGKPLETRGFQALEFDAGSEKKVIYPIDMSREKGPKILVIDDDPEVPRLLTAVIGDAFPGARVSTAPDGPGGIEFALSEDPDTILLDIMMPRMDGFAVCRRLKQDERTKLIPVIFITGVSADRESRIRALEAGGEGFLAKPFDDAELTAQIGAMVKIKDANWRLQREKEQLTALVNEAVFKQRENERRAEASLQKQREELLHMGRMAAMNELAASLAHEINQPLSAILSNTQSALRFLEAGKPDLDEVRDALKDIVEDNRRISAVIRELRDFLKKGEGKREPLDIAGLIQEVLALAHSDLVIRNIAVRKEFDAGLPGVSGNRVQIQQVVLNLIMNGCDAMERAEAKDRELAIRVCADDKRGVLAEISDNGHGFNGIALDRVFEPFFTTKPGGLGLGLTTCKSIIEGHGGTLSVRNNKDKGATVSFTLPAGEE